MTCKRFDFWLNLTIYINSFSVPNTDTVNGTINHAQNNGFINLDACDNGIYRQLKNPYRVLKSYLSNDLIPIIFESNIEHRQLNPSIESKKSPRLGHKGAVKLKKIWFKVSKHLHWTWIDKGGKWPLHLFYR